VPGVQRQAELGHHLLQVANREVDELALPETQQVSHRGQHHVAHISLADRVFQRVGEVLQHDDGVRPNP
jgi:hypothetical protein